MGSFKAEKTWVPEWNGTMAYLDAHPELKGPELGGKFLANMNMDMVGENLELLHSRLGITRTPASLPSCVNDVVENMAEMVDNMSITTLRGSHSEMNYRITPYGGGSDHMMFIDRKIPGMMFCHSDYTHHSSEDTPDKVDPVELERCEMISAGAMWYLANLNAKEAIDLAYVVHRRASDELSQAARTAQQSAGDKIEEPLVILSEAKERSVGALESIKIFMSSDEVATRIDALARQIRQQHENLLKTITTPDGTPLVNVKFKPGKTDTRIPTRLTRGPLDFGLPESKLDSAAAAWYHSKEFTLSGDERFELVNFIDGKRTVGAIRNALSAEFQPVETGVVGHYIEDLVKVGVVEWK